MNLNLTLVEFRSVVRRQAHRTVDVDAGRIDEVIDHDRAHSDGIVAWAHDLGFTPGSVVDGLFN